MREQDLKQYYEENSDFKAYVDRFCRTGRYTVDQALRLAVVEEVARGYKNKEVGR